MFMNISRSHANPVFKTLGILRVGDMIQLLKVNTTKLKGYQYHYIFMTLQTLVLMKIKNLGMSFPIRELTFTFPKKRFLNKNDQFQLHQLIRNFDTCILC